MSKSRTCWDANTKVLAGESLRGQYQGMFSADNIACYCFYASPSFPNLSAEPKAGSIYLLSKAAGLYRAASSGSV